ncbi:MAG: hypothetical protein NTY23_11670 [Chloroflexi bacterium]|nr:hypothetical protein [Chloroflexota bacterium]
MSHYMAKDGVDYQLSWEPTPLPAGADYWRFVIRAAAGDLSHDFVLLVRRKIAASQAQAEQLLLSDGVSEVHSLIDLSGPNGVVTLPDFSRGWIVI